MNLQQQNLDEFWTVQRQSGENSQIFLSDEEASKTHYIWKKAAFDEFEKWRKRESNSIGVNSTLEADGWGGCQQTYSIADYCLPNGIYHHPKGSTNLNKWIECKGSHLVRWGNVALERPSSNWQ